jgi:hypothetical protein
VLCLTTNHPEPRTQPTNHAALCLTTNQTQTTVLATNCAVLCLFVNDWVYEWNNICAEPANGEVVRRQITLNTNRQTLFRPHQRIVMARHYKG